MRHYSHREVRQIFEDRTLKHLTTLTRLGLYITNDREEAEDTVEKTILTAYEHFARQLDCPPEEDKAWLCKIMVRHLDARQSRRERIKRAVAEQQHDDRFLFSSVEENGWLYEHESEDGVNPFRNLTVRDIQDRLRQLPYDFRLVLALRYLDGFTYRQIAEIADLQPGTVSARLQKGRRLLYSALEEAVGA
jgi:RNA polymerase sigma-70 factor (ECF subfamily)